MKLASKGAMIVAWTHVVWIWAGLAAPGHALAQTRPAPPAVASVPAAGGDVIELTTGGLLRGTLIDAIPNGHARIQLVTGEIATVPWQDIAHIERAPGAPSPAPAAVPAAAPEGPDDKVYVHIEGSDVAQRQRDTTGDHRHWDDVCSAPCDQLLPLRYTYRIAGAGLRNSGPFGLSVQKGERETLNVDEGSKAGFVLGIVGASVGSFAATIGLLVVLLNAIVESADAISSTPNDGNGEAVGWTITGVGVAALVGGIVLMVTNARTGRSQTPAAVPRAAAPIALGPWRLPATGTFGIRHEARGETLAPPTLSAPLFSVAF